MLKISITKINFASKRVQTKVLVVMVMLKLVRDYIQSLNAAEVHQAGQNNGILFV